MRTFSFFLHFFRECTIAFSAAYRLHWATAVGSGTAILGKNECFRGTNIPSSYGETCPHTGEVACIECSLPTFRHFQRVSTLSRILCVAFLLLLLRSRSVQRQPHCICHARKRFPLSLLFRRGQQNGTVQSNRRARVKVGSQTKPYAVRRKTQDVT